MSSSSPPSSGFEHDPARAPGASAKIDFASEQSTFGERISPQLRLQRVIDIAAAMIGGVVFLLPALAITVIVQATSAGPVIFVQERVGRDGRPFRVLKFRTMRDGTHLEVRNDAEQLAEYQANGFKLQPDDPRITSIGRWLRRTSLDELPQLINVVKGEMSVVGIRPLLPEELALRPGYDQALYCRLRPGMTGLWQVEGRSSVQKDDRLHLDRRYLETWSAWGDVKIMLRTPLALLRTSQAH